MNAGRAGWWMAAVVLACGAAALADGAPAAQGLKLAAVFGDDMVLQRDCPIPVWGWAAPGQNVSVQLGEANVSAAAGADGRWMVKLPPQKAGGPLELTVQGQTAVTLKNVLIGDVWLCSGQSNMEFGLGGSLGAADDIRDANFPLIRFRKIASMAAAAPAADVDKSVWRVASPKTAGGFCAVGFYFARDVHQATGLPIGLIDTSASSSSIGPWWSPEGLAGVAELEPTVQAIRAQDVAYRKALPETLIAREAWIKVLRQALADKAVTQPASVPSTATAAEKQAATVRQQVTTVLRTTADEQEAWIKATRSQLAADGNAPPPPSIPANYTGCVAIGFGDANLLKPPPLPAGAPGGFTSVFALYNSRIRPLVPFAIKGMLWYQGEANGMEGDSYFHKMRALIAGWRQVWAQGDFPFYFVQLAAWQPDTMAPAGGDGWAKIRDAQAKAMSIPNTGMAVTIDVGDANNIHPPAKYDVGHRLALWALAKDYGQKDIVYSGPIYKQMKVEDGKIRLSFDHVGGGLMVAHKEGRAPAAEDKDGKLARFAIAGADKVWHWADAKIDGETVVVSSDKVPNPVAVRYAFSWNPLGANLYNRSRLPACPFRTDDW